VRDGKQIELYRIALIHRNSGRRKSPRTERADRQNLRNPSNPAISPVFLIGDFLPKSARSHQPFTNSLATKGECLGKFDQVPEADFSAGAVSKGHGLCLDWPLVSFSL
jgi:hypothetical protein